MNLNYGWGATLVAWLMTPLFFIAMRLLVVSDYLEFLLQDQEALAAISIYPGIIWGPIGLWASKVCNKKGQKKSSWLVIKTFLILSVVLMALAGI